MAKTTIAIILSTLKISKCCGGGGGIRTPFHFESGFQDRRIQPLCHPPCKIYLVFVGASEAQTWQGGRDSNPQPTVLETATLPIELPP